MVKTDAMVNDGMGSKEPPIGFFEAWKRSWVCWAWEGCATRREYVYQWCIRYVGLGVFGALAAWVASPEDLEAIRWVGRLFVLYAFAKLFPWIAVMIRRLHDAGFSGWFWFLYMVPIVGTVMEIVLLFLPRSSCQTLVDWLRRCRGNRL